jgi:hypothetical protein
VHIAVGLGQAAYVNGRGSHAGGFSFVVSD